MGMKLCRMTVLHNVQLGCGVLTFVEKYFLKSSVTKVKGDFDIFIKNKENKTTAKDQLISKGLFDVIVWTNTPTKKN